MTYGNLGELGKQAENRKKAVHGRANVPPSRVGASLKSVALPTLEAPLTEHVAIGPAETEAAVKPASVVGSGLVKTTMHIGEAEDAFLDSVHSTARLARPKVDASRSAVVRLAISRLAQQMTTDEIVAELRGSGAQTSPAGGRPRR